METITDRFSSPPQTVIYALGIVGLIILYNFISYFRIWITVVDLPYVGIEKFSISAFLKARNRVRSDEIWKVIHEGYKKYKGEPFKLPTLARSTVYLSPKYFDEIKSLPDDVVSFSEANSALLEANYTGIISPDEENKHFVGLVRGDLTQSIGRLVDVVQDEAKLAYNTELADVTEDKWTEVPIYSKILRIVSQTSGRIFVGSGICRQEEWIKESIMYTVNVFDAANKLKEMPWIGKKLFYWAHPSIKTINASRENAYNILKPEILRRRKAEQEALEKGVEWKERPDDFLEWYRRATKDHPERSGLQNQARIQLNLSMAAIHTTALTTTHIIYDLAAHPQYIDELREEIRSVLEQSGGRLTKLGMGKMSKLDSLMKESQRYNSLAVTSISRQVVSRKGLTLSNGVYLPYGTRIHIPHHELLRDAERFSNPEEFDPFRFHRLRQIPGKETQGQFVTTASDFAGFGHGKHACPGRFFASAEAKGFLVIMLSRYEWRIPGGGTERPANLKNVVSQMPNPTAMIEFKLRPAHERFY